MKITIWSQCLIITYNYSVRSWSLSRTWASNNNYGGVHPIFIGEKPHSLFLCSFFLLFLFVFYLYHNTSSFRIEHFYLEGHEFSSLLSERDFFLVFFLLMPRTSVGWITVKLVPWWRIMPERKNYQFFRT